MVLSDPGEELPYDSNPSCTNYIQHHTASSLTRHVHSTSIPHGTAAQKCKSLHGRDSHPFYAPPQPFVIKSLIGDHHCRASVTMLLEMLQVLAQIQLCTPESQPPQA